MEAGIGFVQGILWMHDYKKPSKAISNQALRNGDTTLISMHHITMAVVIGSACRQPNDVSFLKNQASLTS